MSPQQPNPGRIFVPFHELGGILGITYTRVHIANLVKRGLFPAPRRISENKVAWLLSDLLDYAASRPVAKPKPATYQHELNDDERAHREADKFARKRDRVRLR